ncbi:hypothetical protein ccbrp13_37840 [Ktedonobacteria bacterium brp13]|nr:hypothetical protein ccbrp13_37840 [Ktedonobacteria bacterium brp13]
MTGVYRTTSPLKQTTTHTLSLARQSSGAEWDHVLKVFTSDLFPKAEQREKLFQEMQKLTELSHPHILALADVKLDGDRLCIVMPHAAHGSLQDRFDLQQERLSNAEAISIITQIGEALQYAHERGILHTNIKPGNILFTEAGTACLADFSPSILTQQQPPTNSRYIAPEELGGQFSPQSDQYALAMVTYELLAGKTPLLSNPDVGSLDYHVQPLSKINAAITPDMDQVIARALSANPAERYPGVKDYIDALNRAYAASEQTIASASEQTIASALAEAETRLPRPADKRAVGWKRRALIALACLLILLTVFVVLFPTVIVPASPNSLLQRASVSSPVSNTPSNITPTSKSKATTKSASVSTSTPGHTTTPGHTATSPAASGPNARVGAGSTPLPGQSSVTATSPAQGTVSRPVATSSTSKLLVPAYFYPTPNDWYTMCDSAPVDSIVIMNPNSGAGSARNTDYVTAVEHCQNDSINVIGYVYTSYGSRSLSDVEAEISNYYTWYGIDGIYLDEMSSNASTLNYYTTLFNYIHAKGGSAHNLDVGGMGTASSTDWALNSGIVDILVIFEGNASSFSSFVQPSWASNYPASDFAAIVYGVSGSSSISNTCATLSTRDTITYRYVTDGSGANPYDTLPSYWSTEAGSC